MGLFEFNAVLFQWLLHQPGVWGWGSLSVGVPETQKYNRFQPEARTSLKVKVNKCILLPGPATPASRRAPGMVTLMIKMNCGAWQQQGPNSVTELCSCASKNQLFGISESLHGMVKCEPGPQAALSLPSGSGRKHSTTMCQVIS